MRKTILAMLAVLGLLFALQVPSEAGEYWRSRSYTCRPTVTWRNNYHFTRNPYGGGYTAWQYRTPVQSYSCTPSRSSGRISISPIEQNPYVIPGYLLR